VFAVNKILINSAMTDVHKFDEVVAGEMQFSLVCFVDCHFDTAIQRHAAVRRHDVVRLVQGCY